MRTGWPKPIRNRRYRPRQRRPNHPDPAADRGRPHAASHQRIPEPRLRVGRQFVHPQAGQVFLDAGERVAHLILGGERTGVHQVVPADDIAQQGLFDPLGAGEYVPGKG